MTWRTLLAGPALDALVSHAIGHTQSSPPAERHDWREAPANDENTAYFCTQCLSPSGWLGFDELVPGPCPGAPAPTWSRSPAFAMDLIERMALRPPGGYGLELLTVTRPSSYGPPREEVRCWATFTPIVWMAAAGDAKQPRLPSVHTWPFWSDFPYAIAHAALQAIELAGAWTPPTTPETHPS